MNAKQVREISSVGLERLPYKQRVGGSTPSSPTKKDDRKGHLFLCTRCPGVSRGSGTSPYIFRSVITPSIVETRMQVEPSRSVQMSIGFISARDIL